MGLLFAFALLRADVQHAACLADPNLVCFNYPRYLSYVAWQGIDLNWPALIPQAIFDFLPNCMSPKQVSWNGLRMALAISCVAIFWLLLALWYERLQAGRRLAPERRRARIVLGLATGLLTPLVLASLSRGLISGWHGPTNTIAAFVAPLALCILSLIELGVLPRLLERPWVRIAIAALLTLTYAWAVFFINDKRSHASEWFFSPPPAATDALFLQFPAAIVAELTRAVVHGPGYFIVWAYWFLIVSLIARRWPAQTSFLQAMRPVLQVLLWLASVLILLKWLIGVGAHGPMGEFGGFTGSAIVLYALSRSRLPSKDSAA